ncbi:MAG: divisome protein SepX/GlpR [Nocardioides sp.]
MDGLSGLIFVALAIAWAVYLIPKALRHHDDAVSSRSIDRFSSTMRVLARRDAVSRKDARLVVTPSRAASSPVVTIKPSSAKPSPALPPPVPEAEQRAVQRESTRRATRRRRHVLALILFANAVVASLAAAPVIFWWYVAIPAGLLVAWLVACRLMVKKERAWTPSLLVPRTAPDVAPASESDAADTDAAEADPDVTGEIAEVAEAAEAEPSDPARWDPVPVTLPTYVNMPAARRTVRTIDLDSSGVWTSGRSEVDSALAREAENAERVRRSTERKQGGEGDRATGS